MGAPDVLAQLSALGLQLTAEGNAIRVTTRSALTDQTRELIRAHKLELLASLRQSQPEPSESGANWVLIDRPQCRLYFEKPKTRAELMQRYPGRLVLRLPDEQTARELTGLVARVAVRERFSYDEFSEALERALRDPEAALECFRALAGELRTRARG